MISDREFIPKGDPTMLKRAIARSTSPKDAPMLSEQMKAEGWRLHDGGKCPVPLDMIVDVMFADGGTDGSIYAGFWSAEMPGMDSQWEGECDPDDRIVAYKPEGTPNDQ